MRIELHWDRLKTHRQEEHEEFFTRHWPHMAAGPIDEHIYTTCWTATTLTILPLNLPTLSAQYRCTRLLCSKTMFMDAHCWSTYPKQFSVLKASWQFRCENLMEQSCASIPKWYYGMLHGISIAVTARQVCASSTRHIHSPLPTTSSTVFFVYMKPCKPLICP